MAKKTTKSEATMTADESGKKQALDHETIWRWIHHEARGESEN